MYRQGQGPQALRVRRQGLRHNDNHSHPRAAGKPYDDHTLETVIPAIETQVGATLSRTIADAGYQGHTPPKTHGFKVYTAGQKRAMTGHIKREMLRRSAIEPVIGHLKETIAWAAAILRHPSATPPTLSSQPLGYNFRRILAWVTFCLP